jgi:hypothetical protein
MESNMTSKTESEANTHVHDDDPVHKLKTENDWLREVLIRATREEVNNAKEDTIKLKPKDSMLFNLKEKVMPSDTISALPDSILASNDVKEDRKSLKVSHSFIKRQNSSKKIAKGKVTKDDMDRPIPATGSIPHRREHSSSTSNSRTLSRKDMENIISMSSRDSIIGIPHTSSGSTLPQSSSDVKLPPLSSVHEAKHAESEKPEKTAATPRAEVSSIRLPRLSLSSKPPIDEQQQPQLPLQQQLQQLQQQFPNKVIPLAARFEKVQLQTTFAPSPPHKGLQRTATVVSTSPKWVEGTNENVPPPPSENPVSNSMNPITPRAGSNRMSLNEVVQKFHDFEKRVVVKEKCIETEQGELKKQVDEMKNSLDNLVLAINYLTQKVVPT